MSQTIENLSISIIKYMDDIKISIDKCMELFKKTNKPSELVDMIDTIQIHVKEIDKTVVVLPSLISNIQSAYTDALKSIEDNRNSLICKINDRKASEVQMNTIGDMYDENNLLTDISIGLDNDIQPSIDNIRIDQIIDPKYYSVLSVVNQFLNEKMLISDLKTLISYTLSDFYKFTIKYKNQILELKSALVDGETISKLLEDDEMESEYLAKLICNNMSFRSYRDKVKTIFNIYNSMIVNYGIYNTAVSKYTSFALESVIDFTKPFEFC